MNKLFEIWVRLYGLRRKLATWGLFLFAALLAAHVIFGTNGWMAYEKKKAEYRKVSEDVQSIQQENERLEQQIKSLKSDPRTIEKEAREQLKYARPGEVVYVLPAPKQTVTSTAQTRNPENKK